jgi:hypothetical protein
LRDDVVDRRLVAGPPGGAVAAVGVGDRLQRFEVVEDALGGHGLRELRDRVVVRGRLCRGRADERAHDRGRAEGAGSLGHAMNLPSPDPGIGSVT